MYNTTSSVILYTCEYTQYLDNVLQFSLGVLFLQGLQLLQDELQTLIVIRRHLKTTSDTTGHPGT